MALQDLTPQLRTRLNRMERAVGWFVLIAAALLLAGFGYYLHNTAARKGWFTQKINYQTSLNNAAGLKEGDPVKLMGFPVGEITKITPNKPDDYFGISIDFTVKKERVNNYPGYIWDDSKVKVNSDLLGNRFLEITKGHSGVPTILEDTNRVALQMLRWKEIKTAREEQTKQLRAEFPDLETTNHAAFEWQVKDRLEQLTKSENSRFYTNLQQAYWITPLESPAVNERLEQLVNQVELALPNILNITNKINAVLDNSAALASNLNLVAVKAQPAVSNFALLAGELRGPGALGEWALGTNSQQNLDAALANANLLLAHTDTNLVALLESFGDSLNNLAGITSNLHAQVNANTNILSSISQTVLDADDFVQGLKRHWFLRSAFKKKSEEDTDAKPVPRVTSPRNGGF